MKITTTTSVLILFFQQSFFAQTRVIVNPGLEFEAASEISSFLDTNFEVGATFDIGSVASSPFVFLN